MRSKLRLEASLRLASSVSASFQTEGQWGLEVDWVGVGVMGAGGMYPKARSRMKSERERGGAWAAALALKRSRSAGVRRMMMAFEAGTACRGGLGILSPRIFVLSIGYFRFEYQL